MQQEDLENYFENTIIPQLYVDAGMILRRFTPPAMKQFTLTKADIGKNIEDVISNIRYPGLIESITEVLSSGKSLEKEIQTLDLKWFQMNILPYLLRKENRTNGVIITFVDISTRIEILREMEKLNADHITFIYSVSHDIKQPITVLSLIDDMLVTAYTDRDETTFSRVIVKLNRAVNNIKLKIDELTQLMNNNVVTDPISERVNIENIYEEVTLALKDEIVESGVIITTDFTTSEIFFSRKNLRSILYNILHNAIKFKRHDTALRIMIRTTKLDGHILLQVQDNGIGIDKHNHQLIFNKYARVNNDKEGTGLGLYLVNTMIGSRGGKVELESEPGKGSTFTLYFKS